MRQFIDIITENQTEHYLQGVFYHGTAVEKGTGFYGTAYFTQNKDEATEYAWMDAETDGGVPMLYAVRLHCTNPAFLDTISMQDLAQTREGNAKAEELTTQGHDVVLSNEDGHDEVCVLDSSKIEILKIIKLPYRDGTWPEAA